MRQFKVGDIVTNTCRISMHRGVVLGYHACFDDVVTVGVLDEEFYGHDADDSGIRIPSIFLGKCYNFREYNLALADNSID